MKKKLSSRAALSAEAPRPGNQERIQSLARARDNEASITASSQTARTRKREDEAPPDIYSAATKRKKPCLGPKDGSLTSKDYASVYTISSDDTDTAESKACPTTMINLSVIHGPSNASLSPVQSRVNFPTNRSTQANSRFGSLPCNQEHAIPRHAAP